MSTLFIICGVSASGKSTIGRLLATKLQCLFLEGDDFHPPANIKKMQSKTALNDLDRVDWIQAIADHVNALNADQLVLSCSALTPFVQKQLEQKCNPNIHWIKLILPQHIALERSESRKHFMPSELIASQYDAWRPPQGGTEIDANQPPADILEHIIKALPAI